MKTKYEVVHADTCLPDYWGGHHLPHVQICVRPMYLKEIKEAILAELSYGAIAGRYEDSEENYRALQNAAKRLKNAPGFRGKHFKDVSQEEDFPIYAFFVFNPV